MLIARDGRYETSLLPIDIGFDPRDHDMDVRLSPGWTHVRYQTGRDEERAVNIIDSWIAGACPCDEPIAHAIAALNSATDSRYDHSRISAWRTGARPIPPGVLRYMQRIAIYGVLLRADVLDDLAPSDDETWAAIVAALSPPERK